MGKHSCLMLFVILHSDHAAASGEPHCSVAGPVGARHPVQGLLERFEAGPGCAARERGNKETHVIALRRSALCSFIHYIFAFNC
uniref:Secreted protein n=1 Tax=Neolamprologus brichardi TaxID=32507 RepID=A0A3Q4ML06_NEOBR